MINVQSVNRSVILAVAFATLCIAESVRAQDAADQAAEDSIRSVDRMIVRSSSRKEQEIHLTPQSVSVVTDEDIQRAPANQIGELLRKVPGLNVIQISARDYQVAGRNAGGSLSTGQLVLVDGRTIYLDFFGFVMWDFLPVDSGEIKQIEIVHGPGSAVWGANALTGVINVITKSPRELVGPAAAETTGEYAQRTTIVGGGAGFKPTQVDPSAGVANPEDKIGSTAYGNITHAGVRGKWSYKVSGGYYEHDALARPEGTVPGTETPYPPFSNTGTQQPKFEARVDYDIEPRHKWSVSTGYAGTDGILHSGIGPFDIASGTFLSYGRAAYDRNLLHVDFFVNILDGNATNLLTQDATGNLIEMSFKTQTYNLDVSNTTPLGRRNILTYGGNVRANNFDLTIAPRGTQRNEVGIFAQDEVLLHKKLRATVGLRWDNFDPIGSVWSPRVGILYAPHENHSFRASFSRAFRAPSMVQNFLELDIVNEVETPVGPFSFASTAIGEENLKEETLTAFELGWVGRVHRRVDVSFSIYRNEVEDSIDFFASEYYDTSMPPDGWPPFPLPPGTPVPPNTFPKTFTYRNIDGTIVNYGFEIGAQGSPVDRWTTFVNYSWQDDPATDPDSLREEINTPPRHRFNVGIAYDELRFFASTDLSYVDQAFWTDVLDSRFWGPTKAYRQWNAKVGVRLAQDRVTLSIFAINMLDEQIQQHVFGDIIGRKLGAEARITY